MYDKLIYSCIFQNKKKNLLYIYICTIVHNILPIGIIILTACHHPYLPPGA